MVLRWKSSVVVVATAGALALVGGGAVAFGAGEAPGAPGGGSSWSTGNKTVLGTATAAAPTVWFTAAAGGTTQGFYPRADGPAVQAMQDLVTDGARFRDPERDSTDHPAPMPDPNSLEDP